MKKIAIDCHTLEIEKWAGKEQFLARLLLEIKNKNDENHYVLYFRKKVKWNVDWPKNFSVKNINLITPFWQLAVILHALYSKIEVIFCPCTYFLPAINFFVKSVIVIHDLTTFLPELSNSHKKTTIWREKLCLKLATCNAKKIITVSENTKKDAMRILNIDEKKIKTVYLASDDLFANATFNDQEIEKRLSLPLKYILFVGTFEPRKNVISLIKAFENIKKKNDKISKYKLVLVGQKGWMYEDIFEYINNSKYKSDIKYLDYVGNRDLAFIYKKAACFVYPSFYEGFGLPSLEAMASGCPVITSKVSSLPEVVGDAGILVDPNSVQEISEAITKILSDNFLKKKMEEKGKKRAARFSWVKVAEEIVDICENENN